jgi:hypothetical protein
MHTLTRAIFPERLLLSQEESVVLGELTWRLYTRLGKITPQHRSCKRSLLTRMSSVHVCVGDMNDEEGKNMESQLPG